MAGTNTVLRDLGAPGFQTAYTAARLAEVFAGLRNGRVDMSAVAVLEPQITQGPHIEQGNLVRLTGFFATGGQQLNFELAFQPVDGGLKLFGVSANLAQPQAASGQGAGAATKQAERPNPGTGATLAPSRRKPPIRRQTRSPELVQVIASGEICRLDAPFAS